MSNEIHHPFDGAFKQGMRNIEVARDFLYHYLSEKIKMLVKLDTLQLMNASYIDEEYRQTHSDILYSVETECGLGYVYFLAEQQREPDQWMVLRIPEYTF